MFHSKSATFTERKVLELTKYMQKHCAEVQMAPSVLRGVNTHVSMDFGLFQECRIEVFTAGNQLPIVRRPTVVSGRDVPG